MKGVERVGKLLGRGDGYCACMCLSIVLLSWKVVGLVAEVELSDTIHREDKMADVDVVYATIAENWA